VSWIVFFDGDCGLCSRTVRWLGRLDRREVLRFAPIRGETAAEHGIDAPPDDGGTMVVMRNDGERFERSDAAIELCRALGWPWRLGGVLRVMPRRMRDAAYDFVAKRRYSWFGRGDHCGLPVGDLSGRMLR
jgi:predicted DCC family thiol-disulfide oxidoreductase YuxK